MRRPIPLLALFVVALAIQPTLAEASIKPATIVGLLGHRLVDLTKLD